MTIEIKVGQVWEEVDPRLNRKVRVMEVRDGEIKSVKIANHMGDNDNVGRATWASKTRFNGKRGGYRLIKDNA